MSKIKWAQELKWTEEHLEDLRLAGYAYLRQGKYEIALSFFEALTVLDRENVYDSQTLGALYLQIGQPKNALKWLDHALKIEARSCPHTFEFMQSVVYARQKRRGTQACQYPQK